MRHLLAQIPAGAWAVGVSGHADSTALLRLMAAQRPDCPIHLVHLDHELRGAASAEDAAFVQELARQFHLPLTVARRGDLEARTPGLPANGPARWRKLRHELYRRVVTQHGLAGVLLAHHADDQAETIVLQLLRGAGPLALGGMTFLTQLRGLRLCRPLLPVGKTELLAYLRSLGQIWREDASNTDTRYQRNRVRQWLAGEPGLVGIMAEMGAACAELRQTVRDSAPRLAAEFPTMQLAAAEPLLATEAARCWLTERGAPAADLSPATLQRLVDMAADASTPARQCFPGGLLVWRRAGRIGCVSSTLDGKQTA
jgi:tRNA(Ile)-lysidine synthetase-like protein